MDWTTLSAIGVSAAGILAAVWKQIMRAIAFVHKEVNDRIEVGEAKIEKCEKDRETLHVKVSAMEVDMSHLKGCPAEPCPAKDSIRRAASFSIRGGNER